MILKLFFIFTFQFVQGLTNDFSTNALLSRSAHRTAEHFNFMDGNLAMANEIVFAKQHDFEIEEIWKDVSGYKGLYQCSNFGRIKSLSKNIDNKFGTVTVRKEKILKQQKESNGYLQVPLTLNKKSIRHLSHRLIGLAFIPNPENKPFINHKDGIKANNYEWNLEWCTRSENAIHSFKIGTQCNKGEQHPTAKATNEIILAIRAKYKKGVYGTWRLAKEFGFSNSNIKDIIHRKIWSHI